MEGDAFDGMMTDAEMEYLTAMEEVKMISKKLVSAEQSFTLVRDRIQKLVARYEHLLSKIDAESCAGASSIITCESSFSEDQNSEYFESRERAIWARRAQRAEVKAELAAREALLARQEAQKLREDKQRELEALQQKLVELQSESSFSGVDREHSVTLAKHINMHRHDEPPSTPAAADGQSSPAQTPSSNSIGKNRIDDVKKRFRDRMAARKKQQQKAQIVVTPTQHATNYSSPQHAAQQVTPSPAARMSSPPSSGRDIFRTAGEEMYQQLDFYERSLKAVENPHV